VLRSLARALYSPEPRGHYALATDAYLHFTSPIRRYPDLVAHRMLRRLAANGRAVEDEERAKVEADLGTLGLACSAREQEAEKAERTAVQWKTALYLRERVGEVFSGRISGVVAFGFFVELEEVFADGMVHISDLLDDYYEFDEQRHRLVGERTKRVWRLGDTVKVRLVKVDMDSFQVRVTPVGVKPDREATRARDRRPRPRRGGRRERRRGRAR
jgi:ribonuclease R